MAVGGPNTGFKIIADRILTWGNQSTGNLGLGYMSDIIAVPWIAGTPTNNFAQMSISGDTTLAIGKDKNIYASGVNSSYQFGISSANTNSFIQVTTDGSWKFITSGRYSSLAVKTNGTLWATGTNSSGNLGLGDTTNRSSWTQVGSLSDWSVVYTDPVNNYASYALKTDGTLWGWGYNYFGGSSSSPVLIGGTDTWNSLSYNGWAVHAVRSDGTLWATGANSNYQIGNGSNIAVGSPLVQIGTATNWARVYAASFSTAAIKNDGTLWVWGYNGNGNLGLGNTTDVSTPVQQGSSTNWYSACGGFADQRGVLAALVLGAEAVAMGSRFATVKESPLHDNIKHQVIAKDQHETIYSPHFDGLPARYMKTPLADKLTKKPMNFILIIPLYYQN